MIGSNAPLLECGPEITTRTGEVEVGRRSPGSDRGQIAGNPLHRLVQIVQGNDRLIEGLEASRARIVKARAALTTPAGNTRFGSQYLAHCKDRHRGILAQLRANRIEAGEILAGGQCGIGA